MSRFGQLATRVTQQVSFPRGQWTNITPPGLGLQPHTFPSYGSTWVEVDPSDNRNVYACFDSIGMFKSTDGGFTWNQIGPFDSPWMVRVDPNDSNHLYASQGVRGSTLGFYVSNDAGATWARPAAFDTICGTLANLRDVTQFDVEVGNFSHLILSSHTAWSGSSLTNKGLLETSDGGATWVSHAPQSTWPAGTTPPHILHDPASGQGNSTTWLVGTDGNGLWRTTNSGTSWTQVSSTINIAHGGQHHYYASTGKIFMGAAGTPVTSTDNGVTWTAIGAALNNYYYYDVRGDGTTLYTAESFTGDLPGQADQPFYTSLETDGATWAAYNGGAQTFTGGPFKFCYAATTKRMYSCNWGAGLLVLQL